MVPVTVGVASPRGSIAFDSLSRALLASRGVYAVVGVTIEGGTTDANRGVAVILGFVLDRTEVGWIRQLRASGDSTPVIAVCRPTVAPAAVEAGADGVLNLDDDRLELERAVAACVRGGRWIPAELDRGRLSLEIAPPVVEVVAEPRIAPAARVAEPAAPVAEPAAPVAEPIGIEIEEPVPAGAAIVEADGAEIAEIVAIARSRATA